MRYTKLPRSILTISAIIGEKTRVVTTWKKKKKETETERKGESGGEERYERHSSRVGNSVGYDVYSSYMEGHFSAR